MSDYASREFARLKHLYDTDMGAFKRALDRMINARLNGTLPDHVPQTTIDWLAATHSKMALTVCQYCRADCRQYDWKLDEPSTCQVCKELGR